MIRIQCDILPFGSRGRRRGICEINIANTKKITRGKHKYECTLYYEDIIEVFYVEHKRENGIFVLLDIVIKEIIENIIINHERKN